VERRDKIKSLMLRLKLQVLPHRAKIIPYMQLSRRLYPRQNSQSKLLPEKQNLAQKPGKIAQLPPATYLTGNPKSRKLPSARRRRQSGQIAGEGLLLCTFNAQFGR
jgi:hypothetical protein